MPRVILLNTSIITTYGSYRYEPLSLDEARKVVTEQLCNCYDLGTCIYCGGSGIVKVEAFESAIGHQATAEVLSELLGVKVDVNRINYEQGVGDLAVVFKLRGRIQEGTILSRADIDAIGYDFGLLTRID
jgi:hypothetical protein